MLTGKLTIVPHNLTAGIAEAPGESKKVIALRFTAANGSEVTALLSPKAAELLADRMRVLAVEAGTGLVVPIAAMPQGDGRQS